MKLLEILKMTDEEITNLLLFNLRIGIHSAARGLTESVRSDVGMMFAKYQFMKMSFSIRLKDIMKRRGWLHTPPSYFSH